LSVSGVDSSSLLNTLFNSLNNPVSSDSSPNAGSSSNDGQQTTPLSAVTSINSLLDEMKFSFLQNQYYFVASLFDPDDPAESLPRSWDAGSLSQNSSDLMQTSCNTVQGLVDQYLSSSPDKSSQIKTTV
jgi:hypothetical protein